MKQEICPEPHRYFINDLIGEGRSARVYKAFRQDSRGHAKQFVAVKFSKSPDAVSLLRREFEILSQVRSPFCIQVLAWENLEMGPALVLELVDGVSLHELGLKAPLSEQNIAELVRQIKEAIEHLNMVHLHHGDLSPTNILVDIHGRVRLIDFSIEHYRDAFHGTPAYLAPEVWACGVSDYYSDLFALGLIELDLRSGFVDVPLTQELCRQRADQMSHRQPTGTLLTRDPKLRKSERSVESLTSVREIGQKVRQILRSNEWNETSTQLMNLSTDSAFEDNGSEVISMDSAGPLPRRRFKDEQIKAALIKWPSQLAAYLEKAFKGGVDGVIRLWESRSRLSRVPTFISAVVLILIVSYPTRFRVLPLDSSDFALGTLVVRSQNWLRLQLNGRDLGYAPIELVKLRAGSHHLKWQGPRMSGEARIHLFPGQRLRISEAELAARQ